MLTGSWRRPKTPGMACMQVHAHGSASQQSAFRDPLRVSFYIKKLLYSELHVHRRTCCLQGCVACHV